MNFEELYNAHKRMVYNLALHYVQQTEDAEEITQDVFISVYQSLNSFKEESSISTWLYRITINKSLDFIKARQRKKRFAFFTNLFYDDTNDLKHNLSDENNHPGIQLEDKEALSCLFKYINDLPDKQKTALILHKIEQKSQIEVANIMDISPKALESLVQRAKSNLSKKIKDNEGK